MRGGTWSDETAHLAGHLGYPSASSVVVAEQRSDPESSDLGAIEQAIDERSDHLAEAVGPLVERQTLFLPLLQQYPYAIHDVPELGVQKSMYVQVLLGKFFLSLN